MIISCDKCNKKFEIADKLIPDTGRLLQCGSCLHKWHYVPKNKIKFEIIESKKKIFIKKSYAENFTK